MAAKYLWITGSLVFTILGTIHLLYTFFTDKFSSHDDKLIATMKLAFPKLTRKTTMWKAWIGFNASHSTGAIFLGVINIFIAVRFFASVQNSVFFFVFNIFTVGFYLWLAKRYWFKIPFTGILIAFCCFTVAGILCFTG